VAVASVHGSVKAVAGFGIPRHRWMAADLKDHLEVVAAAEEKNANGLEMVHDLLR